MSRSAARAAAIVAVFGLAAAPAVRADPVAGLTHVDALAGRGHLDAAQDAATRLIAEIDARALPDAGLALQALTRLVDLALRQGDHDAAGRWLARLERDHPPVEPLEEARRLALRARLLRLGGSYAAAREPAEHALALRRRHGAAPLDLARSLDALADLDWQAGRYERGQAHAQEALELARTAAGVHPAELSHFEARLAQMWLDLGDEGAALDAFSATLARTERELGAHPALAACLQYVASALVLAGAYAEADATYERAERLLETFPDRGYLGERATAVYNRAVVAAHLGDFEHAHARLDEALRLWTLSAGPDHPHLAWALTAMGDLFRDEGFESQAYGYLARAVALRRAHHADSTKLAYSLASLARSSAALGRCDEARRLADEAWTLATRATAGREMLERLADRASVAALCGHLNAAQRDFERALKRAHERLARDHPFVLKLQGGLAETRLAQGRAREAFHLAREAAGAQARLAHGTLAYLPEADGLRFAAQVRRALDLALAALQEFDPEPGEAAAAFELVANTRALVKDTLARRAVRQRAERDPQRAEAHRRLEQLRARYASVAWASLDDTSAEQAERLQAAQAALDAQERAAARLFAAARDADADLRLEGLKAALPEATALVAFARVASPARRPRRQVRARTPAESYLAFVLRRGRDVALVPLGDARTIDAHVARWRERLDPDPLVRKAPDDERDAHRTGQAVTHSVWQPLERHLDGARRVLLVPDGPLALIHFGALPQASGYLVEAGPTLHLLSAERDLRRPAPARGAEGLVVLAAATFDGREGSPPERGAPATDRFHVRSSFATRGHCTRAAPQFKPLDYTLDEAGDIAALWTKTRPGAPQVMLTGARATKTRLRDHVHEARVLHVATHGFFLDPRCADPPGERTPTPATPKINPLLLSGLALSGANLRSAQDGEADGVLTALEAAGLDIEGVEWVVLSACGTALGQVQDGEGVLGLRRAVTLAGARAVIMSVMSVDDDAARRFMAQLYAARLEHGLATDEALRRASLARLAELREAGRATPPYAWGAFVASGDWR